MHCVNSFIAHWVRRMNFTDDISGPRFEKSATARTIAVSFAGLGARYNHFPTELSSGAKMRTSWNYYSCLSATIGSTSIARRAGK